MPWKTRDLADIDEIVIDIARDHPALLAEKLDTWAAASAASASAWRCRR